jgi:hypothetical protein
MKREDLKIGDTIKVDGKDVKLFEKKTMSLDGVNYYALIGKTKFNKKWSTDYMPVIKD